MIELGVRRRHILNTLLRRNSTSNGSSKNVGSGCQPSKNRYGHNNDVQGSKKKKKTENWLNQGFSQDDNDVKKKKKSSSESFS